MAFIKTSPSSIRRWCVHQCSFQVYLILGLVLQIANKVLMDEEKHIVCVICRKRVFPKGKILNVYFIMLLGLEWRWQISVIYFANSEELIVAAWSTSWRRIGIEN